MKIKLPKIITCILIAIAILFEILPVFESRLIAAEYGGIEQKAGESSYARFTQIFGSYKLSEEYPYVYIYLGLRDTCNIHEDTGEFYIRTYDENNEIEAYRVSDMLDFKIVVEGHVLGAIGIADINSQSMTIQLEPVAEDDDYDFSISNFVFSEENVKFGSEVSVEKRPLKTGKVTFENLVAMAFNGIAGPLNWCVAGVLGRQVTMDDLIFNHYPDTQLSYFGQDPGEGKWGIVWGSDGKTGLRMTINKWYSFFRQIAIVAYMVMLVYMGIRIILSSTGEKVAQYKTLFMYWVGGVAILFLFPYFMKYTIELNNVFVEMCDNYKGTALREVGVNEIKPSKLKNVSSAIYTDVDSNPFESSGTSGAGQAMDYMSRIAEDAYTHKRLALSFTYLILTWQLITLIIHYYRRLFVTGFLIVIFPIVVISYAIDKIADGKSQGFNKWVKEYILNVFIQSFHAIVYVFICCTVYAGMGGSATSTGNVDYVLVMVGGTFLFTGEEIIKKIFSQESKTATKSLAATATKAMAVMGTAKIAGKVLSNTVGKNNPVARVNRINAAWGAVTEKDKAANLFQNAKSTEHRNNRDTAVDNVNNETSLSSTQRDLATTGVKNVARSIDVLKNPEQYSPEELAMAHATVQNAMNGAGADKDVANVVQRETMQMLANSGVNVNELEGLARAEQVAAHMVAAGITDTVEIRRRVKAELAYTFEEADEVHQDKYEQMVIAHMATFGTNRGFTKASTIDDINDTKEYIMRLEESLGTELTTTNGIMDSQITAGLDALGLEHTDENMAMYRSLYVLNNRESYGLEATLESYEYIKEHKDDNEDTRAIYSNLKMAKNEYGEYDEVSDDDIDVLGHVVAQKISTHEGASDDLKAQAQAIVDEYEEHARDGYYDDEISIHEVIASSEEGEYQEMIERVYDARRKSNQAELEITRAIGTDMLIEDNIDIYKGTGAFYYAGMSREDILKQRRDATRNKWAGMLSGGIVKPYDTRSRYSDGYFDSLNQ